MRIAERKGLIEGCRSRHPKLSEKAGPWRRHYNSTLQRVHGQSTGPLVWRCTVHVKELFKDWTKNCRNGRNACSIRNERCKKNNALLNPSRRRAEHYFCHRCRYRAEDRPHISVITSSCPKLLCDASYTLVSGLFKNFLSQRPLSIGISKCPCGSLSCNQAAAYSSQ